MNTLPDDILLEERGIRQIRGRRNYCILWCTGKFEDHAQRRKKVAAIMQLRLNSSENTGKTRKKFGERLLKKCE